MESHSKLIVTQNVMSFKIKCHSKWNVTQNLNVTQNGMSVKIECHSKWNVTQNGISHKIEYHST